MSASAPPKAAVTPTVLNATPDQSSTTSASPVRQSATETQMPPADVLLVDETGEERDEERRGELDEQRHADREVVDRDEVEPLHERDPDDSEGDEEQELPPADAQATGATTRRNTRKRSAAAVLRICASSSDESPEPRTTFDTLPLTANSVAAIATIA